MFVEFWGVGATAGSPLPMAIGDICAHLLADWVPSLPANVSASFIGWPPFLIESVVFNDSNFLTIRSEAGRSERQWKGVLSWMLGVAGTRHLLAVEGYRWVAPLSAFYPDAIQTVDISAWHPDFPRSSVTVTRDRQSRARLRPDYIALRSSGGHQTAESYQWAVVESKGTQACLTKVETCPVAWARQVRNVEITVKGSTISSPRHLVVATRVNPNALSPLTRRIQLRAWNRKDELGSLEHRLPREAAVDMVAAHLFGLFRSLGLRENAVALALSVQLRSQARDGSIQNSTKQEADRAAERSDLELQQHTRTLESPGGLASNVVSIETELGTIEVEILNPLITLTQELQRSVDDDRAIAALTEADARLDDWERPRRASRNEHKGLWLPFGIEVKMPSGFGVR